MNAKYRMIIVSSFAMLFASGLKAQTSNPETILPFPEKAISRMSERANDLNEKIDRKAIKYLARLEKQEMKLRKKLMSVDSSAAKELFEHCAAQYKALDEKIKNKAGQLSPGAVAERITGLDSAFFSLKFLQDQQGLFVISKEAKEKAAAALKNYELLKQKLKSAEDINQFIRKRKQYLKDAFSKAGLGKYLKKYNKSTYYFGEQLAAYKDILSNPAKSEQMILHLLNKMPAFLAFTQRLDYINNTFPTANPVAQFGTLPGAVSTGSTTPAYNGLQNRSALQQFIGQRLATPANVQSVQNNMRQAMNSYNEYKSGMEKLSLLPEKKRLGFKPNSQKVRSFKERLVKSIDFQFGKRTKKFPTTGNFGAQAGYKINDLSVAGVGVTFRAGLGSGWKQIKFTTESFGARTYLEYRTGKNFYVKGSAEWNYLLRPLPSSVPYGISRWQRSAFIGVSKKITLRGNKSASAQLMYDFLYKRNITTQQQPIVYRISYNL